MASTYLTRTMGSATSRTKFTVSVWIKKSAVNSEDSDEKHIFNGYNSSNYRFMIYMTNTDQLKIRNVDNGTENVTYVSNAHYRDVSGWYHVVVRIDTSQAGGNRIRAYVNGEQITSWASSTEPNQGADFALGTSSYSNILGSYAGTNHFWDGGMSHYHYCDGQSYAPTVFGSTDSTTGEWQINASPSVTYGNQGFFMFDDDSSLTDKSGNGNNFTVGGGTLTKTEDNPSNVFATLNSLFPSGNATPFTYSFGNTKISETVGVWQTTTSTLGASSGKYYAEFKCFGNVMFAGVVDLSSTTRGVSGYNAFSSTQVTSYGYGYYNGDGTIRYGGQETSYGASYTTNDIIGVALDCTNNKLYFSKNGVWQNSGVPTSGSTGTGAMSLNTDDGRVWGFALSTEYQVAESNFGNGYMGTTAVSSAGTNASNNGIFEYDVPTGYTALSTKGLNL